MICLYILIEKSGTVFLLGLWSRSASDVGSTAKARVANASLIMLIQRSWTVERTDISDADTTADMKVKTTAVMLIETWNCKNLQTALLTHWPHIMALPIEEKLLSIDMISEASLATSVQAMPIEEPTSMVFSTGPSLVLHL